VGPRVGLDAVEKRKILHCRESNPGQREKLGGRSKPTAWYVCFNHGSYSGPEHCCSQFIVGEKKHRFVRRFPCFARSFSDKKSVKVKTLEWLKIVV
jgi:hypothetical protein